MSVQWFKNMKTFNIKKLFNYKISDKKYNSVNYCGQFSKIGTKYGQNVVIT